MGGEWMAGKFGSALRLLVLTILLGAQAFAQTTPAEQTPATPAPTAQQPAATPPAAQKPDSGQEPADEESMRRKAKPIDYKKWTFNVCAGANVNRGRTKPLVREWNV